jgi:FkbM family methyltransferase
MLTQLNLALERLTGRRLSKWHDPRERFFTRLLELPRGADEALRRASLDDRFAQFVCTRMNDARAQVFQDLWVLFELEEQRGGYFVEFGASDAEHLSNTWLLEQRYGWTGILAEPNPVNHASLRTRRAVLDTRCVYVTSGAELEFHATDDPVLSTLAQFSDADFHATTRRARHSITVQTVSLDDLLDEHQAPPTVDFLSIDTEGSEYDILSAYSFRRHIRCMSVEHNFTPARETIDRLLRSKGYVQRFRYASNADSWYIHERDLAAAHGGEQQGQRGRPAHP